MHLDTHIMICFVRSDQPEPGSVVASLEDEREENASISQ